MRSPFILVTVLVVASLFTAVTNTVADQPDDIPLIGFDFDNGFSTNQTTVITGSIEDEVKPASVTWSIVASEPYLVELDSGNFSGILEEADSSGSRPIWTWSLEIDVAEYSPCTCYLTVTVETASEGITVTPSAFPRGHLEVCNHCELPGTRRMGPWNHLRVRLEHVSDDMDHSGT